MARLRALTLNLWGAEEPLEARMALAEAGIRALGADVIGLQEVRTIPGRLPNQAGTLAARLGFQWVYGKAMDHPHGGEEGDAILSRFPIEESGCVALPCATAEERRVCVHARLATPAGAVHAYVTHLNWRMSHGVERGEQVLAIDLLVREAGTARPRLVMGDFNAAPGNDEIRFLRGEHTLGGRRTYYQDAFALAHPGEPGATWARRNPNTDRLGFLERDRRLDYIFVSQPSREGAGVIHDCRVVLDQAEDGVFPSDHFGVFAELEI